MAGRRGFWSAFVLVVGCVALNGCEPQSSGETTSRASALTGTGRKIDVLFMVDNSSSMDMSQNLLLGNFPKFMDVLTGQPGGLPNVHVAVVSSDLGAGNGSVTGCSLNGDNGVFQVAPRGNCTSTTLNPGATFISNEDGTANYTAANISTVFTCIAPLGQAGCGFEHQLASVARALGADGSPAPAENQGFLRPDADLAIVLITNEDDCSAPSNSLLFDTTTNTTLASQVGPPGSFRCNEFGHLCGSPPAAPRRTSPNPSDLTTTVTYDGCQSAEDSEFLTPVATFVSRIKALKTNPAAQILVEAVAGPPTPYAVKWYAAPFADTGPWPQVVHSCDGGPTVGFADPAVRIAQFVQAFGANGSLHTICSNDFSPALQKIKDDITRVLADDGTGGNGGNGPGGGSGGGSGGQGGLAGGNAAAGHGGASGAAGSTGGAAGGHSGNGGAIVGDGGSTGTAGGSGTGTAGGSGAAGSGTAGATGTAGAAGSSSHGGTSGATGGAGTGAAGQPGGGGASGRAGATGGGTSGDGGKSGEGGAAAGASGRDGGSAGAPATTGAGGQKSDASVDSRPPASGEGCNCDVRSGQPGIPGLVLLVAVGSVRSRRSNNRSNRR